MTTLNRDLRKALERVSAKARTVAEAAAEKALNNLAVGDRRPHDSMTDKRQAGLRNRLRAHGRQLGDKRNVEKDTQAIDHLVAECAYEHWHRMLFARFLAENGLLVEPASGAAVSIEEVKQLARPRGLDWVALAGEFAVHMLPQVFRQDHPVLEVEFAPEDRKRLEELLLLLPETVFLAGDSLGWCYQFWQAERKDEVNKEGNKIGADELPAVTQLFTEDYMVDFLLDNTLGAWHAGKVLGANTNAAKGARNEEEVRLAVALPGCPWTYLRFMKNAEGTWTPAAGTFDAWPRTAEELRCLDPCMGSGHFLVAMFERLAALRLAEDDLGEAAAAAAVIHDNLFGLEIDQRCTQIGAFNLALAAWRRVGHCKLPAMNLACSGLAPNSSKADWLAIAGDDEKLKNGMDRLYRMFKDAPVLGSLINPRSSAGDLLEAGFIELQPLLAEALALETKDDSALEMAVTARGLAKAAEILAGQFTLVATNVPYLGAKKQDGALQQYCVRVHPHAKSDLATCFVERSLDFCADGGSAALVTPQNWLFLGTYKKLRQQLLAQVEWDIVIRLGEHAFESAQAAGAFAALVGISKIRPNESGSFMAIDVAAEKSPELKADKLYERAPLSIAQSSQLDNPDARITFELSDNIPLLGTFVTNHQGLSTGDNPRFRRNAWEVASFGSKWEALQSTVDNTEYYGGRSGILLWENGRGDLYRFGRENFEALHNVDRRGAEAWGQLGVSIAQMRVLPATIYGGQKFDTNAAVLIPKDPQQLPAVWAFCSSTEFHASVRRIDQKVNVTNATLVKVPFDLERWSKVAAEKYPRGLPRPLSSDQTQWLFNGHPADADQPLHVAVARLLGYQWPRQTGSSFPDCPALGPDGLQTLADEDGIVPISPTKGEGPAAERLRELLARALGRNWNAARQTELLAQVNFAGASLEDWLRNGFFEQHCAHFDHCPFIWHVWDGLTDGFQALVNYHQLSAPDGDGRRTLDKLTFSYLGDWIARQKAEQKAGKEGADGKLAAAAHLQEQLKKIRAGEPPYDLFVRWKPLRDQAVGWNPDINDGVRLNIRPFMMAKTLNGKSVFRKAPKLKWEKDRGKEPERSKQEYPWFWSWDGESDDFMGGRSFDGNRWNDLHYSNAVKEASRVAYKGKKR